MLREHNCSSDDCSASSLWSETEETASPMSTSTVSVSAKKAPAQPILDGKKPRFEFLSCGPLMLRGPGPEADLTVARFSPRTGSELVYPLQERPHADGR
jgi:hypothetical protein